MTQRTQASSQLASTKEPATTNKVNSSTVNESAEPTEVRTKPKAADLRKFRNEVEAFRREYAGTHALSVEGLSEDYFPVLKQTMTSDMWNFFEKTGKQLKDAGKSPQSAASEAYIKTLSAEKANRDQISVEEMEKIRNFMKDQQE